MRHTDANAMAGLFEELFARDLTAAERICQSWRTRNAIGAHRRRHGAGRVLVGPTREIARRSSCPFVRLTRSPCTGAGRSPACVAFLAARRIT
jgi:hypothetical protein